MAAAYRSLGRSAEAEQTYLSMLDEAPQDPVAIHLALGDLYSSQERLDDAIAQYRLATEAAPGSTQAAYRLGRAYLRSGAAGSGRDPGPDPAAAQPISV